MGTEVNLFAFGERNNNNGILVETLQDILRALHHRRAAKLAKGVCEKHTEAVQVATDGAIFALSFASALLIRFAGTSEASHILPLLLWLPFLVVARLCVNVGMGVYRIIWRFVCISDASAMGRSLCLVTIFLTALRLFYPRHAPLADSIKLPLSIIALEFLISLTASVGVRGMWRILNVQNRKSYLRPGQALKRVLLYGAGEAGILLARELADQPDIEVVGFVDDDPRKHGTIVSNFRVLGSGESLGKIVRQAGIDEVVVSVASASPKTLSQIISKCQHVPVTTQIIPTVEEIMEGRVKISHTRDVRIEDLLGREPLDTGVFGEEVEEIYRNKRILVTGAGGSIGSELTRQLLRLKPQRVLILDKDENSIYELEQELKNRDTDVPVDPLIADIKIRERLFALFAEFRPEVVFHAAAHKHVPLMERHPCEAVLNNIYGTENVLEACRIYGTARFIFISTDKAVNPTNIMGATKRVGEKLVQAYANGGSLRGACVRFGNVMGSRGSVIPLFNNQIALGGPLTVTNPDMMRYFMTIPEAVQLILCAGTLANRGDVFVLDMGSPRKILDLARRMIELAGLEPGKDIEIAITGLRAGEKMNEELVAPNETLGPTRFEKILAIGLTPLDEKSLRDNLARVIKHARCNDRPAIYKRLALMDLGFTPTSLPLGVESPQSNLILRAS